MTVAVQAQRDGDRRLRQLRATTPTTPSINSTTTKPPVEVAGTELTTGGEVGVTVGVLVDVGVVVDVGVMVGVGVGSGKQTHGSVPMFEH